MVKKRHLLLLALSPWPLLVPTLTLNGQSRRPLVHLRKHHPRVPAPLMTLAVLGGFTLTYHFSGRGSQTQPSWSCNEIVVLRAEGEQARGCL